MRRLNPIIGYTAALTFILAGCAANIEPTDLSSVTVESDRSTVEQALGKPDYIIEKQDLTVTSHTYDKGHRERSRSQGGYSSAKPTEVTLTLLLLPLVLANAAAERQAEVERATQRQKGQLAAIYDSENKLLFAGSIHEPIHSNKILASLADQFAKAQTGDPKAMFELGRVALIPRQKQTFLQTASNAGSPEAAFELGQMYAEGIVVERNDHTAVKWWLTAGKRDYAPAYMKLGKAYQTGSGVARNRNLMRTWYGKAATPDFDVATPAGKYALALAFQEGDVIPTNFPEAKQLLRESAEAGHAPAQSLYGTRIHSDDPVEAFRWQQVAARQGYVPAMTRLGGHYLEGHGVESDREEGKNWLRRAAEEGDESAIAMLRKIESEEIQVQRLHELASNGHRDSQRKLGDAYRFGEGVQSDIDEAIRWYEMAAENGHADTQYLLGSMYEFDDRVQRNSIEAYKWYSIAEANFSPATFRRESISKKMSSDQVERAKQLAREWLEDHPQ